MGRLTAADIHCLYNTDDYGLSFHSIEKQLIGYTGPWLLLVHHIEKNRYIWGYLVREKRRIIYLGLIKTEEFRMFKVIKGISQGIYSPWILSCISILQTEEKVKADTSGSTQYQTKDFTRGKDLVLEVMMTKRTLNSGLMKILTTAQFTMEKTTLMALGILLLSTLKNCISRDWNFGGWVISLTLIIIRNIGKKDKLSIFMLI